MKERIATKHKNMSVSINMTTIFMIRVVHSFLTINFEDQPIMIQLCTHASPSCPCFVFEIT